MRRIDQERRATFQPPPTQQIQLRPLSPVIRTFAKCVTATNYVFPPTPRVSILRTMTPGSRLNL